MAAAEHRPSEGPPGERPLLAPWLRRTVAGGRLVLEYGDELVVLGGERALALLDGLLPLLDGTRSAADAAAELGVPAEIVESVVSELAAHGLAVCGPAVGETALLCAALARNTHPAEVETRLSAASVAIVGGSACAQESTRLLATAVGEAERVDWEDDPAADLVLAAPAPSELPRLAAWNERALRTGTPWLQLLPFNGRFAAVGPLFVPDETCCERCYRERRGAALGEPALVAALDATPAAYPQGAALSAALAGLGASLAVRWLATREPALPGMLFALELADGLRIEAHRVLRVPRCPACSPVRDTAATLPWGRV